MELVHLIPALMYGINHDPPLARLLIETDCPFLAPVPYRGKRNEPAFVVEVARCLAEIHGTDPEQIGEVTANNFSRLFEVDLG